VSITYALGSILGGAFAPTIAQWIRQATGSSATVAYYLLGMCPVGLVGTLLLRDRKGIDLARRRGRAADVHVCLAQVSPIRQLAGGLSESWITPYHLVTLYKNYVFEYRTN
jgi:hypothetical protein